MMKYKVGDRVKIKSAEELYQLDNQEKLSCGYCDSMDKYTDRIATITKVVVDNSYYELDIDDGCWYWEDAMFDDNIDDCDNKIENRRFKYEIGYHRYEDRLETFEGFIENFYPSGKSAFINENGKLLVIPYERIEFIVPKESNND